MIGICSIAAGLVVDRDRVESDEEGVDKDGKDGWKDVQHVHDGFDQHDEHGEDGNNDVVICYTVARVSRG